MNTANEGWLHIQSSHPEITIEELTIALQSPDEVRKSKFDKPNSKCTSQLFYRLKRPNPEQFTVVVVKFCPDGNFVTSAYSTDVMKTGETVFEKGERDEDNV